MREPPAPRGQDLAITADRYAEASARVIPHNLGILPRNETQNITATSPTNGDTIEERRTERAPSTWPRAANSFSSMSTAARPPSLSDAMARRYSVVNGEANGEATAARDSAAGRALALANQRQRAAEDGLARDRGYEHGYDREHSRGYERGYADATKEWEEYTAAGHTAAQGYSSTDGGNEDSRSNAECCRLCGRSHSHPCHDDADGEFEHYIVAAEHAQSTAGYQGDYSNGSSSRRHGHSRSDDDERCHECGRAWDHPCHDTSDPDGHEFAGCDRDGRGIRSCSSGSRSRSDSQSSGGKSGDGPHCRLCGRSVSHAAHNSDKPGRKCRFVPVVDSRGRSHDRSRSRSHSRSGSRSDSHSRSSRSRSSRDGCYDE